jgi:hypothetical protein
VTKKVTKSDQKKVFFDFYHILVIIIISDFK